ncbi:sigma-70 family RNA polymerase sigma factor [Novosphingobium sp. RD2P27]|uniref:Sigma-70 family RNA polymerase sigma factor n=1 Tax=Novosphingobium kalidii TaxID=3230299 RepID=A0ABV2D228_9SPHN
MERCCDVIGGGAAAGHPVVDWQGTHAALVRYLLARRVTKDLAEDIAQETIARLVVISRSQAIASVFALAFRIANNLLVDQARLHSRSTAGLDEDMVCDAPSLDRVLDSQKAFEVFQRCLNRMPPLRREVLVRRRLQHQSCRSIGEELSLSDKAVEKHISRALDDLRRGMTRAGLDPAGWNQQWY